MPQVIKRRGVGDINDLPDEFHPVLKRVLAARNITTIEQLNYSLSNLLPYTSLGGITDAAALIADCMQAGGRLLIVADYDADGATACALAVRALTAMGAVDVRYMVPDRFRQGYGLSTDVAAAALALLPDIIITVDNGISSIDGVKLVRENGAEVIITDHHLPGKELPDASVIVNPNLAGDRFPSKHIAGVGVMFYVLAALRAELRQRQWFAQSGIGEPNLAQFLDLVALGTVADVVTLDYNNRILVANGLTLIRSGKCSPGIRALLQVAKRPFDKIVASDLGFFIGPRLNAAGRLTDMGLGIECLLCDDDDRAAAIAGQLDALNRERKEIQNDMHEEALVEIERFEDFDPDEIPHGVCLYKEHWHQGVVGILASKIKEKLHRPVVAFAADEDGMLKGSARSVTGVHIRDVIERIATENPGLIAKYGGHAMAAGLTLEKNSLQPFSGFFDEEVKKIIMANGLVHELMTDGGLQAEEFNLSLAEVIRQHGPWGQGYPEPLFDNQFEIVDSRIVGEKHLKLQLRAPGHDKIVEAIAFNLTDEGWPAETRRVQTVYRLDVNEFRGRKQLQLIIDYLEPING